MPTQMHNVGKRLKKQEKNSGKVKFKWKDLSWLLSNCPVATLNLLWPKTGYPYAWHWMTITGYSRDTFDNRWITVSTWGEKRIINYRAYFQAMFWFGGVLMYFN